MFENTFRNLDDVLWKEAGCSSELVGEPFDYIIDDSYAWSTWAAPKDENGELDHDLAATGKDLIAFALAPVTREERVIGHRDLIFSHYDDKQQAFLDFVLTQYINVGVNALGVDKLPALLELKYHGIHDATEVLGEVSQIRELFIGFQKHLFEDVREA